MSCYVLFLLCHDAKHCGCLLAAVTWIHVDWLIHIWKMILLLSTQPPVDSLSIPPSSPRPTIHQRLSPPVSTSQTCNLGEPWRETFTDLNRRENNRLKTMSAPTTGSPNMDVTVVSKEMALLSNLLAAYTFVAGGSNMKNGRVWRKRYERRNREKICWTIYKLNLKHLPDQPERTALVFLGGVCVGLLITLSAIVFQIHCRADCHYGNTNQPHRRHRKKHHHHHHHHRPNCPHHRQAIEGHTESTAVVTATGAGQAGDSESEEWDETADLSTRRRRRFERALLNATMFTSAEGISSTNPQLRTLISAGDKANIISQW